MVAVIETDEPGDGNRHVAGAHLVMIFFYAILVAVLARILFGIVGSTGFDDSAKGISWTLGVVLGMVALHGAAARGARLRRRWARTLSRVLAVLLMPAIPVGTAIGIHIFRNTRPGRWISMPVNVSG